MANVKHAQMIDIIGKMDSPLLGVHKDRCMLVRNRNAECLRCAAVCTTGAISRSESCLSRNVISRSICDKSAAGPFALSSSNRRRARSSTDAVKKIFEGV